MLSDLIFRLKIVRPHFFQQGQRLHSIALQLRLEKLSAPRQCCLMKGHMALLKIYSDQEMNMQNYVIRLLEQVNKLNSDENKLPVLRIMIDGLESIYSRSNIFALDEYMLFGEILFFFYLFCKWFNNINNFFFSFFQTKPNFF